MLITPRAPATLPSSRSRKRPELPPTTVTTFAPAAMRASRSIPQTAMIIYSPWTTWREFALVKLR
jgi:hypothetical protein